LEITIEDASAETSSFADGTFDVDPADNVMQLHNV